MATRTLTLRQIIKVEGVRLANRDVNSLKTNIDSSSESLVNMATKFISVGLAMKVMTDSYSAFIVQRDAIKGIDIAIKNMGVSSTLSSLRLQKMASDLQEVSNYGDELTLDKAFRPLILAGLQSLKVINDLVITMADVAAGTVKSFDTVANQITRLVADGNASVMQLSRATGIAQKLLLDALRGVSNLTLRAIILALILGKKFGGSAKLMIDPMKQLSNTVGDLKLELGKAFYPVIKPLALMATAFLSNLLNVKSIIKTVKTLSAALLALGFIKFGDMFASQISKLGTSFKELNNNIKVFAETGRAFIDNAKNVAGIHVVQQLVVKKSRMLLENLRIQILKHGVAMDKSTKIGRDYIKAQRSIGNLDTGLKELNIEKTASLKQTGKAMGNVAKSAANSAMVFASSAVTVLGYIGVAIALINIVKNVIRVFKLKRKAVLADTKALLLNKKKLLLRRQVYVQTLQQTKLLLSLDNITIALNEQLSKLIHNLKHNYNLLLPIEGLRALVLKRINELLLTQKGFNVGPSITKLSVLKEIELYLRKIKESLMIMNKYANIAKHTSSQSPLDKDIARYEYKQAEKLVDQYTKAVIKLRRLLLLLNLSETPIQSKNLSALSTYYNTVKFEDLNYLKWQLKMNLIAANEFKKMLRDNEFSLTLANEFRIKLLKATNDKLYLLQRAWIESTQSIQSKNLSALSTYYNTVKFEDLNYLKWQLKMNLIAANEFKKMLIDNGYSLQLASEFRIKLLKETNDKLYQLEKAWIDKLNEDVRNKNKADLAKYYDLMGMLDSNYYVTKKQMIEELVLSMNISDLQKKLLLLKRIDDLEKLSLSYQNFASIATSAIESISSTLMSYVQITAKSSNVLAQIWHNLANSIIALIGRIITRMTVLWVLEKSIGLFRGGFGIGGAISGVTSGGGLILDAINGQIASIDNNYNPISNTPITTPNTTIRSNDNSIIDKLNEVIDAININGIKGKIHTINRIELARLIDIANMERSVL